MTEAAPSSPAFLAPPADSSTPEPQPESTPEAGGESSDTPPWGDDFDAEKAWRLVQNLRTDKENLRIAKEELAARPTLSEEQQRQLDEYNRLVAASQSELERTQAERDRWQTEATNVRSALVESKIEALATPDFALPTDAVEKLKANNYLDAGGVIDEAAIKRDLAAVLDERPHWRRQAEPPKPRVPAPNPGQGSGGGGTPADPRQEFAAILQGLHK